MYLAGFFVDCVGLTPLTVLLELNALRVELLVLLCCIVAALALFASERNECSHDRLPPIILLLLPPPSALCGRVSVIASF